MVFLGLIVIAVLIAGIILKNPFLLGISPILFLIVHIIRYNKMMSFAENLAAVN